MATSTLTVTYAELTQNLPAKPCTGTYFSGESRCLHLGSMAQRGTAHSVHRSSTIGRWEVEAVGGGSYKVVYWWQQQQQQQQQQEQQEQ